MCLLKANGPAASVLIMHRQTSFIEKSNRQGSTKLALKLCTYLALKTLWSRTCRSLDCASGCKSELDCLSRGPFYFLWEIGPLFGEGVCHTGCKAHALALLNNLERDRQRSAFVESRKQAAEQQQRKQNLDFPFNTAQHFLKKAPRSKLVQFTKQNCWLTIA